MEDDRTRKHLERLADMYLTASPFPNPPPPEEVSVEAPADADAGVTRPERGLCLGAAPRPVEVSVEGSKEQSIDQSPSPLPGTPKPNVRPAEFAPIRLASEAPASRVEAVFLGNLPGFGGPWLAQYAHFLAEQFGPVVILNVDQDQVNLELVSSMADREWAEELSQACDVPSIDGLMTAMKRLTVPGLPSIGAWLVHLPMPLDDISMYVAPDLDRWTLICGSDQAAAVGAYRWVKQLVECDSGVSTRTVGLMVMGSDHDKSQLMAANLSETAASFLDTPVRLAGCRKRIEPVHLKVLGSYQADQGLWPQITAFLADISDLPEPAVAPRFEPDAEPFLASVVEPIATSPPVEVEPAGTTSLPPPIQEQAVGATDVDPSPADPDLAQFVESVMPIEARCPYEPDMQLAVDDNGRLHLLLWHRGSAEQVAVAMTDLAKVRTWAIQHVRLLALTWLDGQIDQQAVPVVHLFTEYAGTAAALVAHVDAYTRLHLLQRITVGSGSTWFCAALN